jgi:hypothetical protein
MASYRPMDTFTVDEKLVPLAGVKVGVVAAAIPFAARLILIARVKLLPDVDSVERIENRRSVRLIFDCPNVTERVSCQLRS